LLAPLELCEPAGIILRLQENGGCFLARRGTLVSRVGARGARALKGCRLEQAVCGVAAARILLQSLDPAVFFRKPRQMKIATFNINGIR